MKTKLKEQIVIKPIKECFDIINEDIIEELYEKAIKITKEKKIKRSIEEKTEYIIGYEIANYMSLIIFLNNNQIKSLEDILYKNKLNIETEDLCKLLLEEQLIFKVEDTYYVPEELKETYEDSKKTKLNKDKTKILVAHYMVTNGVLEVKRLINLINESGYEITKKELLDLAKEENYKVKKDVIYLNEYAEIVNEDNTFLESKESMDYKVASISDAFATMMLIDSISPLKDLEKILKKYIKDKKELKELLDLIFNVLLHDFDFEEEIEYIFEDKKINLGKDLEKIYDVLEEYSHILPSWSLNGYSEHEFLCDEEEFEDDFEELSDEEKLEIYVINYVGINGIISVDKIIEILNKEHNLKVTKKKLEKILKENEFPIVENYACCLDFSKEDFKDILSIKKLDKYKILEDIDEFIYELEDNEEELNSICEKYKLNEDTKEELNFSMKIGMINEEILNNLLEDHKCHIPLKKQHQLYKELKKVSDKTRAWVFNGFTLQELNEISRNDNKKETTGRNEPCPCGSGKKYKKCCGK